MNPKDINRDDIIDEIKKYKHGLLDRFGVTKIGIFGSVARGETEEKNDIDIVVEMKKPNLFYMVHIKEELEQIFDMPVDIVRYRPGMNPYLKARIDKEAVYVG